MMPAKNRFMVWLQEHITRLRSHPKNGRKAIREIDFMLLEINDSRKRVRHDSDLFVQDTQQAKRLVAEGNDALKYHNS